MCGKSLQSKLRYYQPINKVLLDDARLVFLSKGTLKPEDDQSFGLIISKGNPLALRHIIHPLALFP